MSRRGIVTDRDIVVRALADGREAADVRVRDVRSADLVTLKPQDTLDTAAGAMRRHDVTRIPVVDGDRPVGILSIGDLAVERDPESALADISAASPTGSAVMTAIGASRARCRRGSARSARTPAPRGPRRRSGGSGDRAATP